MTALDTPDEPGGELRLETHFSIIPEWVLDADISDRAVRLYGVLLRYGQTSGVRIPGRSTLARRLRCSLDSLDRAVADLERVGALVVTRSAKPRKGQSRKGIGALRTNVYLVRSTPPGGSRTEADSRTHAATPPSRTTAATVAAPVRPNPECFTDRENTSTTAHATTPPIAAVEEGDENPKNNPRSTLAQLVTSLPSEVRDAATELHPPAGGDLREFLAWIRVERRAREDHHGDPLETGRWHDMALLRAMHAAIADGYPPAAVPGALYAIAVDAASVHPNRLSGGGPWWDGILKATRLSEARTRAQQRDAISDALEDAQLDFDRLPETVQAVLQQDAEQHLAAVRPDWPACTGLIRSGHIRREALTLAATRGHIPDPPELYRALDHAQEATA